MFHLKQFQNYYDIKPGECPRDFFVIFDDTPGKNRAICRFDHPFIVHLGANGKRNVGVSVSQISLANAPMNISAKNHTSMFFIGEDKKKITLRDGYYESMKQFITEVQLQADASGGNFDLSFDHLGYCTYSGSQPVFFPVAFKDELIPDNHVVRLGFSKNLTDTDEEAHLTEIEGFSCLRIENSTKAIGLGDFFGPFADALLTCDQAIFTKETQKVLGVFGLACRPSRSYFQSVAQPKFRALHESAEISELTFSLRDRFNREIDFVAGTPCATVNLMHLG
ncbi:MAG: LO5 [Arowana adomavirus]|uniref:LO5 n=1 Tax=Arowana adomavirus TaxID=2219223 RepID=A0A2U9Q1H2_9VIRU|nr:MAG: LO5 [Arowana adomavirus]